MALPRSKVTTDAAKFPAERRPSLKIPASSKNGLKSSQNKAQRPPSISDHQKKTNNNNNNINNNHICSAPRRPAPEKISWNVLDLKKENYFSCAVGRTRTNARYTLGSSDDVVAFLMKLAGASLHPLPPPSQYI